METIQEIQSALTDELLREKYRSDVHPLYGHCYVATEALYHLLGAEDSDWTPHSSGRKWNRTLVVGGS